MSHCLKAFLKYPSAPVYFTSSSRGCCVYFLSYTLSLVIFGALCPLLCYQVFVSHSFPPLCLSVMQNRIISVVLPIQKNLKVNSRFLLFVLELLLYIMTILLWNFSCFASLLNFTDFYAQDQPDVIFYRESLNFGRSIGQLF